MDNATLLAEVTKYLDPRMLVVTVVLFLLGLGLKTTPMIKDWMIVWILPAVGIVFGLGMLGISFGSVIQGILAAAISVLTHQIWKQTKEKL